MYRKRIGNVVFFPGVEKLPVSHDSQVKVREMVRKLERLEQSEPSLLATIEYTLGQFLDAAEEGFCANGGAA